MKRSLLLALPLTLIAGLALGQAATTTAPAKAPAKAPAATATKPSFGPADKPATRERLVEGKDVWMPRHEEYVQLAKKGGIDVYFEGDSITDNWHKAGKEVWEKEFAPMKAANFGVGGDRTQHVLWRLQNGEFDGVNPKVMVLMIGTNNSNSNTAEEIVAGVKAIVETVRTKSPSTKILLLAIFPRGEKPDHPQRIKNAEASKMFAKLDDGKMIRYLDIGPKFLDAEGVLSKNIMPDLLHPNAKGYQIWADAIREPLKELMK